MATGPLRWIQGLAHDNSVMHAPSGYVVPGFAFAQAAGVHVNNDRNDRPGTTQGNGAGASMKLRHLAGGCA